MAAAAIFDKDHKSSIDPLSRLHQIAEQLGLHVITVASAEPADAAIDQLAECPEPLLFVHLTDETWQSLLNKLDSNKNAVRLSNSWLEAGRPISFPGRGIGFRCLKQIVSLTAEDVTAFLESFGDEQEETALRSAAYVPKRLEGLLRFEPVNNLVTAQLILNLWVAASRSRSGRGEPDLRFASSALALATPAELAIVMRRLLRVEHDGDWDRLWEAVGREMGLPKGTAEETLKKQLPDFHRVLTWLKRSTALLDGGNANGAGDASLTDDVVERASKELQNLLATVR